jgi:DNA-binding NarL/FixJ family response regulator
VRRPRILLAEDHQQVADQLRALLETEYDVVGTVPDGDALVLAFETLRPQIVISDIGMPGADGFTAARTILKRDPAARIIFVTVRDEHAVVRRALELGACGYVLKGDAGEELLTAVRAALAGRIHVSTHARTR